MTLSLKHSYTVTGTDAGNAETGKDEWNAEHLLTMATARLVGRSTAGDGAAEEISIGANLSLAAGTLNLAASPQVTSIELGHASDTTLTRVSAGVVAIEGTNIVKAGAATASGLTVATDRLLGRDTAGTGAIEELSLGSGLGLASSVLVLNGPAFLANKNGTDQTGFTSDVSTLVTFGTEVFDTNGNFASSRFTPTVAGYYAIECSAQISGTGLNQAVIVIYKNGTVYSDGTIVANAVGTVLSKASALVSMNGSTDYVEVYSYLLTSSGTGTVSGSTFKTQFSGCFVRGL